MDMFVILGLLFCVFTGYSVLPYASNSLTYWLPDRIKTINWLWKAFSWLDMSSTTENSKKYSTFFRFLLLTSVSVESSQFWSTWMTFNRLKTNSTKLLSWVFLFFTFSPWCNIPFLIVMSINHLSDFCCFNLNSQRNEKNKLFSQETYILRNFGKWYHDYRWFIYWLWR